MKGLLWRSGGPQGGEEECGIVGVLVMEPKAGGDVGGGEIVDVVGARTQRAADEEDGRGEQNGEPGEKDVARARDSAPPFLQV